MAGLILWLGLAMAADRACAPSFSPPDEALSVAWVSPLGRKVRAGGWITLVPTRSLRTWANAEAEGRVARLLQRVGLRESDREPRRGYKIVVFDVVAEDLCRPLSDREGGELVDGLLSCPESATRLKESTDGCGHLTDLATGEAAQEVYRARWKDVVLNGFCVLPAERFLQPR